MTSPAPENPRDLAPRLAGARAVVFGLGKSGVAACRLLRSRGASVTATDRKSDREIPEAAALAARGVTLVLGGHPEGVTAGADLVVLSPGIDASIPPVATARQAGVPVLSEVEIASWFIDGHVVGITGSNGKTTTTALTGEVLRAAGIDARVGGNIGTPLASLLPGASRETVFVAELSSFQLDTTHSLRCDAAVLLNVTPDHLDRYGTMEAYARSKERIFRNQTGSDAAILNAEDPRTPEMLPRIGARPLLFSSRRRQGVAAWLTQEEGGDVVIAPDGVPVLAIPDQDIPLLGRHNRENVMAALLCAWHLGADMTRAADGVRRFRPVPHRLELVAEAGGVRYVNDSKATNLDAVKTALLAMKGPVVLLLGGRDKGAAWGELPPLLHGRTRLVVTLGEAAPAIEAALGAAVPFVRATDMADAVGRSHRAAQPGDTVLLAPGCASFDMFRNYEHRGETFVEEVRACLAS